MPVKTGTTASNDYLECKRIVEESEIGETWNLYCDGYKRSQKYLYEIGLKQRPRREFSTKKISENQLQVTRIA